MRCCLILSLLIAIPCWSQTIPTGKAETSGTCSPAVTGSKNTFTITCGIDKKQGQKMLDILNKILAKQIDPDAVMTKLDEISAGIQNIQHRTSDRWLTDSQITTFSRALRRSPQSVSVTLVGDREANAYGQQIVRVLESAGWSVTLSVFGYMSPAPYGIMVSGNDSLLSAFSVAGIDASSGNLSNTNLLIGLKPY